jgi:ADP-ribose pyrophosphatase
MADAKILSSTVQYTGKTLVVRQDIITTPAGERPWDVVVRPDAAAVVAVTDDGRIVLVEQYRHPAGQTLFELPAGKLDGAEDPAAAALRELAEEVGYDGTGCEHLTSFFASPGYTSEILHVYRVTGLRVVERNLDEDEDIAFRLVTVDDAIAMIKSGEIRDGKTIVGILAHAAFR